MRNWIVKQLESAIVAAVARTLRNCEVKVTVEIRPITIVEVR